MCIYEVCVYVNFNFINEDYSVHVCRTWVWNCELTVVVESAMRRGDREWQTRHHANKVVSPNISSKDTNSDNSKFYGAYVYSLILRMSQGTMS